MNEAERLLRQIFRFDSEWDAIGAVDPVDKDSWAHIHPDARYSMFGPTGIKEMLVGRDAFVDFVSRCAAAISERSDEIVAITGIDDQCAFVQAHAYRKSRATGEEIRYDWAMLYRVENGQVTYGADMLDADAQTFWGRVLG
jgi:ketosteroid isomerase-like protein